jgi:pimeloyl-ACP methyl ester carboxylesterase
LTPLSTIPDELEQRIRRDLARGRRIVRLTWIAALVSLFLGLVAIRQAAFLVSIDRDLVTTEEVQGAGAAFDIARLVLVGVVVVGIILAVRWLRDALPVFAELRDRGVIAGPPSPAASRGPRGLDLLWRDAGVPADRAGWSDLRVGAGRRLALVAAASVVAATAVGLGAALWLGAASDADMSRMLRIVSGIDGGLWLVACILVGVACDAILWREAAAARALGMFIPLVDAPGRAIFRLAPPILIFLAGTMVASGRPDPWFVPCPSSSLSCDGMLVPVDHDAGSAATIWVVYGVHHAAGPPVGTLAIAVGGPGSSGLDDALPILAGLDADLVRDYDILFWDQRGVGASEGRDCPDAGTAYFEAEPGAAAAEAFVGACLRETGVDPGSLARYATRQAAEDLDSIRDHLGIARFALYGESYGTELAQAYAARHADRLTALILDGSVDLTRSANAFWADAAHAFDTVLTATLAACAGDRSCASDAKDPSRAYAAGLRQFSGGRSVSFGDRDGVVRDHRVDSVAIEAAVDMLLYDPAGRMQIQRAVAAFDRGDEIPLARLATVFGGGEGEANVSSFAYHAVTCADYRVSPTADPHDLAAVEAAGAAAGVDDLRTAEVYATQYPCLYWPYQPTDGTRPAPLTATAYPVFVLGATADPITSVDQARAIAGRLSDGYLIVTEGGAHVTFGRGDECVDRPVVDFLLEAVRPWSRTITCGGDVADPYVPLTPIVVGDYRDALDAMAAAESELFAAPEYAFWDGSDELRVGCRDGGFFVVTAATIRDNLRFADCQFADGLALTGLGTYTYATGVVAWNVTVPDGQLDYESSDREGHVEGTWNGAPVDLTR